MVNDRGNPIAFSDVMAGNHNDLFQIAKKVRKILRNLLQRGIVLKKRIFIADAGFDCKELRRLLQRFGIRVLIKENPRNSKSVKPGRKKYFDETLYKTRFVNERSFAWMDSFRTLLVRFDTTTESWLNWHYLAGFLLNVKV
jgi:transposase